MLVGYTKIGSENKRHNIEVKWLTWLKLPNFFGCNVFHECFIAKNLFDLVAFHWNNSGIPDDLALSFQNVEDLGIFPQPGNTRFSCGQLIMHDVAKIGLCDLHTSWYIVFGSYSKYTGLFSSRGKKSIEFSC